jgi:hypothetical protein
MAMKSSSTVAVSGLREFRNELRRLQTESGGDGSALLKDANWKVAQFVVGRAQSRAGTVGRQQARAAESLRASKTVNRAQVAGGSAKMPFFFGAEFGAKQNILRSERRAAGWAGPGRYLGFRQFKQWRKPGGGNTGYFLFPTLRAETQNIIDFYADELDKVAAQAFPEGRL